MPNATQFTVKSKVGLEDGLVESELLSVNAFTVTAYVPGAVPLGLPPLCFSGSYVGNYELRGARLTNAASDLTAWDLSELRIVSYQVSAPLPPEARALFRANLC
jgi:hypothetical protein